MHALEWIAEQRIREGIEDGAFDAPGYRGRRVALEDDESIPPELRMAFKILRDAGCLPPEIELRKEIGTLSELLEAALDPEERRRLRRDLDGRRLRLALLHER